ncbi:uncharacterized protein LOC133289469 [Gastrolobium bilobum]|uniref:uncharacterized protein LOC133289469 n=1 Tax=Gastrolobium bilobum TaxID=150636 RepID=UPI002AAF6FF6|nr:uncharacterized protein LOC133289469 [Gastrolobium bilobum]
MADSSPHDASKGSQRNDTPVFTNYVNVPLHVDKLDGSNYDSWAFDLRLWLDGQDYADHLIIKAESISVDERPRWKKVDAQLCSIIKSTIHPSLKQIFRAHVTCESVWRQAKSLYTNDTQRLYGVCQNLVTVIAAQHFDVSMSAYLEKVQGLLHDFNELLPPATDPAKELEQRSTFFMLMALYGFPPKYSVNRDQILDSTTVPSLDSVRSMLLRIPPKSAMEPAVSAPSSIDPSALVSKGYTRGQKPSKGRLLCTHCNKPGHTIDRCWDLHGRPPRSANFAQSVAPALDSALIAGQQPPPSILTDSLQWYKEKRPPGTTVSGAHTGNSFADFSHSRSLGPWILDSGAFDHISGNKFLFTSLCTSGPLPSITMANGSLVQSQEIVTVLLFPSIPINNDRSSRRTLGVGSESNGLYQLSTSVPVCFVVDSPLTIHAQLGHPSLAKLQKMVPRFSNLSSLSCESCQLGKHTRSSFPDRVNRRSSSPFALVHSDIWFQTFFTSHGILHKTSCSHTPQQNGVAERKNCHLIETIQTLLLHSHIPFQYWGDDVLTTCYLINRMPSSVLNNQVPHSVLFPHQPLYPLTPHVFGSTCFVHNLSPGLDKLSAKSHKCIFPGYPRSQKGYRCYSPSLRHYFVSADVTFFESISFFDSSSFSSDFVATQLPLPPVSVQYIPSPPPSLDVPAPVPSVQVYHRRQRPPVPQDHAPIVTEASVGSLPSSSPPAAPVLPSDIDLPIALGKTTGEALSHSGWRQAMIDEMCALQSSVKVGPDGQVDHLKARLVAKGYTQETALLNAMDIPERYRRLVEKLNYLTVT